MKPTQKLKHAILLKGCEFDEGLKLPEITAENIDAIYKKESADYALQDAEQDVRQSGEKTGIPAPFSRHYEGDSVAAKMPDGTWVGWVYWHGGGKHGEPEAIDWMGDAYDLNVTEQQKTVTVRAFTKPTK